MAAEMAASQRVVKTGDGGQTRADAIGSPAGGHPCKPRIPPRHERAINVHVGAVESGHDIVFLHHVEPGPASRSYGVQVARLAGMPAALIRQARATLEALEAKAQSGQAQVDLFAPPPPAATAPEGAALTAALEAIDPDRLSPREALEALYRLKALSRENPP